MHSQKYDEQIYRKIAKWAEWMDVQIKSAKLKLSDAISILHSLHNLRTAYQSNFMNEVAAMRIFQHFMKDPAKAALAHNICATKKEDRQQEWTLTTNCDVVNYTPVTYSMDNFVANVGAKITNSK